MRHARLRTTYCQLQCVHATLSPHELGLVPRCRRRQQHRQRDVLRAQWQIVAVGHGVVAANPPVDVDARQRQVAAMSRNGDGVLRHTTEQGLATHLPPMLSHAVPRHLPSRPTSTTRLSRVPRVLPDEERIARGRAHRLAGVRVREPHAALEQRVQVRRVNVRVGVARGVQSHLRVGAECRVSESANAAALAGALRDSPRTSP